MRTALAADLAVTVAGVVGFLGFLFAARMDDTGAWPFDVLAIAWPFTFGALKLGLPWLLSKRALVKRRMPARSARIGDS
jgi:hypothetical protein